MSSLKELRGRIKSVQSTEKITKAMKIVAAARLKGARNRFEATEPYLSAMSDIMQNISASVKNNIDEFPLLCGNGKDETHLLVIFSSERGLCGPLNTNLNKSLESNISKLERAGKKVKLFPIGKKGFDYCVRYHKNKIHDKFISASKGGYSYEEAVSIAEKIVLWFEKGEFDTCSLLHNQFVSVMLQKQKRFAIIPLQASEGNEEVKEFAYEPKKEEILKELIPKNIALQIYNALLETTVCELSARMTAMDSAKRNAEKLIKELNLQYNRSRQMQITNELIEIISGAEVA